VKTPYGRVRIIVKTNSKSTEIIWDENKKIFLMDVKAKPVKGEANKEIIRYLNKTWKKKVKIISGFTSRTKTLLIS